MSGRRKGSGRGDSPAPPGAVRGRAAPDAFRYWAEHPSEAGVFAGETDGSVMGRPLYWVTGWETAGQVLRDSGRFSSRINYETMGPVMGKLILSMDGEEHRRYRDLVARAFRASSLERWADELIQPTVDSLVDAIAPKGRADLVSEFTHAYPVQIIASILGVPVEDHVQFQRWAEDINCGPTDWERSRSASSAMTGYLEPIVAERRANPTGDLISDLVSAEVSGRRLDDEHLYGFLRLLLPAGAETTYRALGNALLALLTHPRDLARVAADPDLVPAAIEETLRWETPVTMVSREAVEALELGGARVAAGSAVVVATAAADRDPSRYERGELWDLDREPRPHMAFGTGRHQCLGMHLARMEMRIALETVLRRLRGLRLDPGHSEPEVSGFSFRSPESLPVLFEAER